MPVHEEFQKLRTSLDRDRKEILDRFLERHSKECEQSVRDEIDSDKRHVAIINLIAFAFSESGPLRSTGYHFMKTEPLFRYRAQEGNKIFDIVLYSQKTKRAVLVEVKSSIEEPRRDALLPLKDQIANARNHLHELENEVTGEINDLEYVICGPPQDVEEIGKKLHNDDPACLWSADIQYSTLKIFNPTGTTNSERTAELIRKRQLNIDPDLREKMYGKTKSQGQMGIRVLTTSHICRMLSRTIAGITQRFLLNTSSDERRFWMHELISVLMDEIPGTPAEDLDRIAKEIIALAIKLRIVELEPSLTNPSESSYKLKVGTRTPKTIEDFVEGQYIKQICEENSPMMAIQEFREFVKKDIGTLDQIFSSLNQDKPDIQKKE
ncbi:hypothetical protein [Candidatus Nitrososphaera sp. FF02]|uniref:hypothetical protein n=1 Tax=Candidatus Nitrososphaera sp. FF02 TaxID=3398226 RepID=UPI0039E958AE